MPRRLAQEGQEHTGVGTPLLGFGRFGRDGGKSGLFPRTVIVVFVVGPLVPIEASESLIFPVVDEQTSIVIGNGFYREIIGTRVGVFIGGEIHRDSHVDLFLFWVEWLGKV